MQNIRGKLGILLLGVLIGYYTGIHSGTARGVVKYTRSESSHIGLERSVDMDGFWDVWEIVDEDYPFIHEVEDTDDRVEGAIKGMLQSLDDPYTQYMDAEESQAFDDTLGGKLHGIGAEVTMKNGLVTVVSPLKNSPAIKAGIQAGDIIASIDGESTMNMTLGQAVKSIRGEVGSVVKIEILRKGEDGMLTFDVTRNIIHFDSVEWKMLKDNIAYIEIIQFDDNTKKQFTAAVNELSLESPKGLVLDVRDNSGGFLDTAVDVLTEFTDEEKIAVMMKTKELKDNQILKTTGRARMADIPMVLLINEGSASASEIVAGALRDWGRAKLVGMNSFGKGRVQELRSLKGGASMRITVAKWNTPNDININKEGIAPDIAVDLTTDDHNNDRDPQLACALEILTDGTECEDLIVKEEVKLVK